MSLQINFNGKVALVTGSTSGIGKATAIVLAKAGAYVFITGRNEERGKAVLKEITSNGGKAELILADLIDFSTHKKLIDQIISKAGGLDILVNNSGIFPGSTFQTTSVEELDKTHKANVDAPMSITKYALQYLKERKGNIINLSSVFGYSSAIGMFGYSLSKSANLAFTYNLALELAPYGVRVNAVSPGVTETEGVLQAFPSNLIKSLREKGVPMGRNAEPEEIANGIAFLASDLASFITGVNLPIDGGNSIVNPLHFVLKGDFNPA